MITRFLSTFALLAICLVSVTIARAAELVIALGADVTSIDPHNNNAAPNNSIAEQIFNKLIENDPRQNLKPGLAESWRAVDDLTWEFKLRRGVKFHDGSDFTAADVAYSIERPGIINTPGGFTIYTRSIVEKTIVDPYTIRLKTAAPYPNMPTDMAGLIIVSSRAARGERRRFRFRQGDDRHRPVEIRALCQRRPHRARAQRQLLGTETGVGQGDVSTDHLGPFAHRGAPVRRRADDRVVPTADFAKLKTNKDITVFTTTSNRMIHLHLDSSRDKSPFVTDKAGKPLDKNPFKDARVRKAISKAINRNAIVERVMEGLAMPAGQLMPEGFFGVSPT